MIRRLEVLIVATILVVAAFSTGWSFLFYLLYLAILVIGGSYVLVRLGLTDLEAGYAVSQLHGHVGDRMRVTYTLRNGSRLPKPWLEIHNPTTLPGGLPGRAITLAGRSERSWLIRVPLTRRGHFRIEPLHIRTGDPFGFFEAAATVGQGVSVIVYPRLEPIPAWRLPSAILEGSHASPVRTLQTTPLATTVRPYAPGDSMNRIHWKTTARHGEIQVKEFDLEQTADAWIILDLQRGIGGGRGDESSTEAAIRAAAAIADKAIAENRAVGMTVNAGRTAFLPADRGGRQHQKIMQLLAAVEADGNAPLVETLIATVGRLRRGMTAVVITSSLDPAWVRPLANLRARGVSCVAITVDAAAYERVAREAAAAVAGDAHRRGPGRRGGPGQAGARAAARARRVRAAVLPRHARAPARRDPGPMNRRIPLAPAEGWLSLGLVMLLCVSMAWAIDDVALVLGNGTFTDFLAPMALAGVLIGFIGAKVGWGRWLTYLIGSIFAALIVPLVVGLPAPGAGAGRPRRLHGDGGLAGPRGDRPHDRRADRDRRVRPLHAVPRARGVGHLDVRRLRDVRPAPAAQCDRHHRARPADHHVPDLQRSGPLPGAVHDRRAGPARALSRPRRADGVDPPTDRRSRDDLERLPARRHGLHRCRDRGFRPPDERGAVGAARGDVVRLQQQLRGAVPVDPAIPADRRFSNVAWRVLPPTRSLLTSR